MKLPYIITIQSLAKSAMGRELLTVIESALRADGRFGIIEARVDHEGISQTITITGEQT